MLSSVVIVGYLLEVVDEKMSGVDIKIGNEDSINFYTSSVLFLFFTCVTTLRKINHSLITTLYQDKIIFCLGKIKSQKFSKNGKMRVLFI